MERDGSAMGSEQAELRDTPMGHATDIPLGKLREVEAAPLEVQ